MQFPARPAPGHGCFILLIGIAWFAGCDTADKNQYPRPAISRSDKIHDSLARATRFLLDRQSPDGAWRSETYGAFKDGNSLTPLVLHSLLAIHARNTVAPASRRWATTLDEQTAQACREGTKFLTAMVRPDGSIDAGPTGLSYPVYTSSLAVVVLSHPTNQNYHRERDAWLAFLRQRQLTENLGWQPTDREYGGWGYSIDLPRKPASGQAPPLTESNLSATVFALEALKAANCPARDHAFKKALVFVERCQNYHGGDTPADPTFDDGGFFFIYDDRIRNKAGVAGRDKSGRERYHSYGSTTADGLRALLASGLPVQHPRVVSARRWLEKNFSADDHPGAYVESRHSARPAVYFYYCRSLTRALSQLNLPELSTPSGQVSWSEQLADSLMKRQREDGSWSNPAVAVREDDPVLATSLAAAALVVCRNSAR